MPMPSSGSVTDPVYGIMLRCWDVDPVRKMHPVLLYSII